MSSFFCSFFYTKEDILKNVGNQTLTISEKHTVKVIGCKLSESQNILFCVQQIKTI